MDKHVTSIPVEFEAVTYSIDGRNTILDRFSLIVNKRETIVLVGRSGAGENTFALVVRRADAEAQGFVSIADLAPRGADLVAGFGPEFMARPDGYPGLREVYGLEFGSIRQLDLGLMYRALADNQIDVAVANFTDGQIAGLDLLVLDDDRHYFPPYQAAPVVRGATLEREPRLSEALSDLADALTPKTMRNLNYEVDVEGRDVSEVV